MAAHEERWNSFRGYNLEAPSKAHFPGCFCSPFAYENKLQNMEIKQSTMRALSTVLQKQEEKPQNGQEIKTRRRRASYKRWQLDILEEAFAANCYPSTMIKKFLAARLDMESNQVQVWFQNRRARMKKDGSERYSPYGRIYHSPHGRTYHSPYGRTYPPTFHVPTQIINPVNRTTKTYLPKSSPATPMFSAWHLDHVLRHNHVRFHTYTPTIMARGEENCNVTPRRLIGETLK